MKGFLVFLLLVAAIGGGGYYCYSQGHLDKYFPKTAPAADPASPPAPATTGEAPKPASTGEKPATTANRPAPKPAAPSPKPAAPEPAPAKTEFDRKAEEKYPMPNFKPLLEIVGNWNSVPKRAFPRAITVNVEAEYQIKSSDGRVIGSSKAAPGHKAVPLMHRPGKLQITDRPGGTALSVVNVDDTDFKAQIQNLYDTKVAEARERILKARRVYAKFLASKPSDAPATAAASEGDPRFQPVRDFLAAGKLESGILEEAKEFYWLGRETHKGRTYDAVLVNFEVQTLFGMFPNSMKCLLDRGQVVKWVDADTGEERR